MYPYPLFQIGTLKVYLYGVFMAVGIIACIIVLFIYAKKIKIPEKLTDFIFIDSVLAIAFGFLSAHLFEAFYDWLDDPSHSLHDYIWGLNGASSGVTVMGGVIGGATIFLIIYFLIGHFLFKKKDKNLHLKYFTRMLDLTPCVIMIAHAFGRIGCLMAGCCHGKYLGQSYVPGGIWMDPSGTGLSCGYYVPTQLYESLFLFVWFAFASFMLLKKKCNIIMPIYLIGYGIFRFCIEFIRYDYRGASSAGLYPSQWVSIGFIIVAIVILVLYWRLKVPYFLKTFDTEVTGDTNNNYTDEIIVEEKQERKEDDFSVTERKHKKK